MTLLIKCKNNLNFNIIKILYILYLNNYIFFAYCNVLPLPITKPPQLLSNSDQQSLSRQFASVPNTSEQSVVNNNDTIIINGTLIFSTKVGAGTQVPTEPVTQPSFENQSAEAKGVWCYCNFPQCVRTGYMCHSESDKPGCFSKSVGGIKENDQVHLYRQWSIDTLARGCIELLPRAEGKTCLMEISNLEEREGSNANRDQPFDYNNYLPKSSDKLRCCQQNMCNYEIAKPIIIREIDESEVTLSPERGWLQGLTIGVSVLGIVLLIFLMVFAGKILTSSDDKSRSSELLNELSSRDFYIKVPYFIERSPSSETKENPKAERCSILCVKSLQKNIQRRHAEDVADYCRFHPLSLSSSNRHSFSCPSSLAILPPTPSPSSVLDDEGREELQPLRRDAEHLTEATLQEL